MRRTFIGTFLAKMAEALLEELAKPVEKIERNHVLELVRGLNGGDASKAPMIFFLLESLFDFVKTPGCTVSLKDLVKAILSNATLTPILYQVDLPRESKDPDLHQMLDFIASFKSASC